MKTLCLLRHAKSSWDNLLLSDHQRPLAARGISDCKLMAPIVFNENIHYDQVYVSDAKRADETITRINKAAKANAHWHYCQQVYTFKACSLLDFCQQLDTQNNTVLIVGHNPAITELVNILTASKIANIPTCSWAKITGNIKNWEELKENTMRLEALITPKHLKRETTT